MNNCFIYFSKTIFNTWPLVRSRAQHITAAAVANCFKKKWKRQGHAWKHSRGEDLSLCDHATNRSVSSRFSSFNLGISCLSIAKPGADRVEVLQGQPPLEVLQAWTSGAVQIMTIFSQQDLTMQAAMHRRSKPASSKPTALHCGIKFLSKGKCGFRSLQGER